MTNRSYSLEHPANRSRRNASRPTDLSRGLFLARMRWDRRSGGHVGGPRLADQIQLPDHGPQPAAEAVGDLLVRIALHLHQCDPAQRLVAEALEPLLALVGHHRRE